MAMALVVLMQQNGRVEGLLKRLLTWKLNLAARECCFFSFLFLLFFYFLGLALTNSEML